MHNALKFSLALSALSLAAVGLTTSKAAGPIPITFWHYVGQESGSKVIADFAKEFNASRSEERRVGKEC